MKTARQSEPRVDHVQDNTYRACRTAYTVVRKDRGYPGRETLTASSEEAPDDVNRVGDGGCSLRTVSAGMGGGDPRERKVGCDGTRGASLWSRC